MQKAKIYSYFLLIALLFSFILNTNESFAATNSNVYFKTESNSFLSGSNVNVQVYLNAPVPVNAIDIQIFYPKANLDFVDYDNSNSIMSFWQGDKPQVLNPGHIELSGGILHSFQGNNGLITTLKFKANAKGQASLSFERSTVYLSDGLGTDQTASTTMTTLNILGNQSSVSVSNPTTQQPIVVSNPKTGLNVFSELMADPVSGSNLIVFYPSDSNSEIRNASMRYKNWLFWSNWMPVQNPALFPGSAWQVQMNFSNDFASTTKTFFLTSRLFEKILISILVLCFVVLVFRMYNKKRR